MLINFEFSGKKYCNYSIEDAVDAGIPASAVNPAAKLAAQAEIVVLTDAYRKKISEASADKLAEYRVKEEIANDPASASAPELALISREATARGTDQSGLIDLIKAKSSQYRETALLFGAVCAEKKAEIDAISDDSTDIESEIDAVLTSTKEALETAYQDALNEGET